MLSKLSISNSQISILLLLLISVGCFAQDYGTAISDAKEQLNALSDACRQISSITSKVAVSKQTKMIALGLSSEGKFYMQKEGSKIAIETGLPAQSRIVITDKLFLVDVAGKQTKASPQSNPALTQLRSIITACMSGDFDGLTSHSNAKYFDSSNYFTIVITPTNKRVARYMQQVVLRFSKTDNTLEILQMVERNGDATSYTFTEKQFNRPIDDKIFQ
ncbi:MAG: outer membrane lipoprotein carrier protein LolA [Marinilabiliaceae bacterium]|jgi:outer membrane lipoprotein-sorting protein|nr:outer membrane lipoprotein carrier protein LolA [Bacteroidales bacterium]MCR5695913.1 outer membrane lipoprotein carrier protein LolA [Marinilabiliaceae bacterium]